jgi:hypothetical protein
VASIDEELVNDSDSDADCVPQISSNEDSDDENDILDSGPGPSVDQVFHSSQEIQQYNLLFKMEQI